MNKELSSVQGVSEELAKNILSNYEGDIEKLSQVNPVKLSIGYSGVGIVTANRIKAWAAATVQKTMTPQRPLGSSSDGPLSDISDQVEVTEPPQPDISDRAEGAEGSPPPASARVQRIRAASNG